MVVYAEQILIDNFFVDATLMFAVTRVVPCRTGGGRIAASAALGACAAVVSAVLGGTVALVLKLCVAPLMTLIVARFSSVGSWALALGVMLGLTACFGGACYAIMCAVGAERLLRVPFGAIAAGVCVACVLSCRLLRRAVSAAKSKSRIAELVIGIGDKTARCQAYLDTGNTLVDDQSGAPVVLIDAGVVAPICYEGAELDLLRSGVLEGVDGHKQCFSTATGKSQMFVLFPDRMWIYLDGQEHRIEEVAIGIAFVSLSHGCRALVDPLVIKGGMA